MQGTLLRLQLPHLEDIRNRDSSEALLCAAQCDFVQRQVDASSKIRRLKNSSPYL